MTKIYRVAGQAAPTATTNTTLYTVPALTQFVGSSLMVCNRDSQVVSSFNIAVVPNGETLANKHYIKYGKLLDGRGDERLTIGMTLGAGDAVVVWASTANLSFTLFGSELS